MKHRPLAHLAVTEAGRETITQRILEALPPATGSPWLPHRNAPPLQEGQEVISWKDCPKCDGRGWFLREPFITGGSNGVGGLRNMTQCQTCKKAFELYEEAGALPDLGANSAAQPRLSVGCGGSSITEKP